MTCIYTQSHGPPLPSPPTKDVLHNLRPRLKRLTSYDEALAQVNDILRKEAEAGGKGGMLGAIDEEGGLFINA